MKIMLDYIKKRPNNVINRKRRKNPEEMKLRGMSIQ